MKYYRFRLTQQPEHQALVRGPEEMGPILHADPGIQDLCEISRSTYYRLARKDAQAFWDYVERVSFGEEAAQ